MPIGKFRNLVLARAIAVEPIARALCADPVDADATPGPRTGGRWRPAMRFNDSSHDGGPVSNQEETKT